MKTIYRYAAILLIITGFLFSAIPPETVTWIKVGSLHSHFQAWGAERAWNPNTSSYEGLRWPAQYANTDNFVVDRPFMACKDFTGPDGELVDYKSVKLALTADNSQIIPQSLVQTARYTMPAITVDGVVQTSEDEVISEYHSETESTADRMVTNVVRTGMGVTMTRKAHAYSRKDHDNYNIIEYIFENTGNIDDDDSLELDGTIHDFYFGLISRFCTSEEVKNISNLRQASWGAHQWVHHTPMNDDPDLPYFYSWLGQARTADIVLSYDNIGAPVLPDEAILSEARLRCPQFVGTAVLHSDQASDNITNDKSKVRLGWYVGDEVPGAGNDQQIWTLLNDNYQALGHMDTPQDVYAGHELADRLAPYTVIGNPAGTNSYMSFGPYNIPHGESVKIVLCEGVSGLSREKAKEVGENWYKAYSGESVDLTLPTAPVYRDPETISDDADSMDIYKNMWVYTGKDSIVKTFYLAKQNYDSDPGITLAPPPPGSFTISSAVNGVDLEWGSNPSTDPGFEGYRLYRTQDDPKAPYELIFECSLTEDNIVQSYTDTDCEIGHGYYYYVTSYTVDLTDGIIESGQVYTQTNIAAGMGISSPLGDGTEENPYKIGTLANLLWLSMNQNAWDKHYQQTAHINASETSSSEAGFIPIGNEETPFSGVYNGNGYTIDSLHIQRDDEEQIGLFGYTNGAVIQSLGLTNAGISGYNEVGGLIGQNNSSVVQRCFVDGSVSGVNNVGGISGKNIASFIDQCYNLADVTGAEYVGGLSGSNTGTVYQCYSAGAISGTANTGGLISSGNIAAVHDCFWDTDISGQASSSGGTGLTSADMKSAETYLNANWDLANVWTFREDENNGYLYFLDQKDENLKIYGAQNTSNNLSEILYKKINRDVSSFGICWNINGAPTIIDSKTEGGTMDSLGYIISEANGLDENTYYYIRAFQTDGGNTDYSNSIIIKTTVFGQEGSPEDPFQISDTYQLKWVSENPSYWNKHYIQTADIDAYEISNYFGTEGWSPIGYDHGTYLSRPFTGSFNGQGNTINALHLDRDTDNTGLFGYVLNAELKKICMTNADVSGANKVGCLAGHMVESTIDSCHVSGTINGLDHVGGLAGYIIDATLTRSSSNGTIAGQDFTGGLIGVISRSSINKCFSTSSIDAEDRCGGLIGSAGGSVVSNSYATGSVSGRVYVGGLVANLSQSSISSGYCNGSVSGLGRIGGLVGYKYSDCNVNNSFWDKQTTGQSTSVGGSGKTTAEMKDLSTYTDASWVMKTDEDEGIWNINQSVNDGYPVLSYMYPEVPVPVSSGIGDRIPEFISLDQNYPNPFNPITAINYRLPENSDVELLIYDITGKKIKTLVNDLQFAGHHTVNWDASEFSSGIYFYRLIIGDFVDTKKMVLMK
ncbi:MAG: T9SS type A sorting domain-containing protein [Candidatus Marinimicrobia bacterium]|nr:T9SS type A sorting domain-containing protein [Candidatus Neomarinimicrobiota bacterium]